jgi:hypothetical protein
MVLVLRIPGGVDGLAAAHLGPARHTNQQDLLAGAGPPPRGGAEIFQKI